MIITITMFCEFCLAIEGRKIDLSKRESELLALLVASGGQKITAKNYWEIIEKPKKYAYSARYYSTAAKTLRHSLITCGAEEILKTGLYPVRFCRIAPNSFKCDYYDMLDGKRAIMSPDQFLQDYPWATDFYCRSRNDFHDILNTNPLFKIKSTGVHCFDN